MEALTHTSLWVSGQLPTKRSTELKLYMPELKICTILPQSSNPFLGTSSALSALNGPNRGSPIRGLSKSLHCSLPSQFLHPLNPAPVGRHAHLLRLQNHCKFALFLEMQHYFTRPRRSIGSAFQKRKCLFGRAIEIDANPHPGRQLHLHLFKRL